MPGPSRVKSTYYMSSAENKRTSCAAIGTRLWKSPAQAAKLPVPKLVVLDSPYRFIVKPFVDYAMHCSLSNRIVTSPC